MWSFDPSPFSVLHPDVQVDRITTFPRRKELLLEAGADSVKQLEPTPELLSLSPEAYIAQISEVRTPEYIVEGAGFRFGNNREGTIQTLHSLGKQHNFECIEVQGIEVTIEDYTIVKASSSMVRSLINEGRMQDVNRMLGREYELSGVVTKGDCRGRELGVPTANLGDVQTMLPRDGIYAGKAIIDNIPYIAAISIGTKPTFGSHDRVCEAHLIGFDGGIGQYDWPLTVTISHWIRDQIKFDSEETLTIAIEQDIQLAIKLIESTV